MTQNLHPNSTTTCPLCGVKLPPLDMIAHLYGSHASEKWSVKLTFVSPAGDVDEDADEEG